MSKKRDIAQAIFSKMNQLGVSSWVPKSDVIEEIFASLGIDESDFVDTFRGLGNSGKLIKIDYCYSCAEFEKRYTVAENTILLFHLVDWRYDSSVDDFCALSGTIFKILIRPAE